MAYDVKLLGQLRKRKSKAPLDSVLESPKCRDRVLFAQGLLSPRARPRRRRREPRKQNASLCSAVAAQSHCCIEALRSLRRKESIGKRSRGTTRGSTTGSRCALAGTPNTQPPVYTVLHVRECEVHREGGCAFWWLASRGELLCHAVSTVQRAVSEAPMAASKIPGRGRGTSRCDVLVTSKAGLA